MSKPEGSGSGDDLGDLLCNFGSILGTASTEELLLVPEAAEEPYVRHVMGWLRSGRPIHHDVTDWHEEMKSHIMEKFPLSEELASLAIANCETNIRLENSSRG